MSLDSHIASRLKRDANGLFTAVVQERGTGQVLMVAWMDDAALARTLETREATYYSRSRGEQWVKGATSGHTQHVHSVRLDCDGDTVLLEVDQVGAACHTGDHSCFDANLLLGPEADVPGVRNLLAIAGLTLAAWAVRRRLATREAMEGGISGPARSVAALLPVVVFEAYAAVLALACGKPGRTDVTVTRRRIGEHRQRILVVTAADGSTRRPAVLWLHGGGMILGSPEGEQPIAGLIARELGVVVVLAGYRLAPEHPFPAALDDCMAALSWRVPMPTSWIDPYRISVVGPSAGGNLSAAVAQRHP